MPKRILLVVRAGVHAAVTAAALGAARLVRDSGGVVRLMYVSPLPPPRVDRDDRVVADTDREIARIGAEGDECLRRLAAEMADVPVERVVRFGHLAGELRLEAEVFAPDLVGLAAALRPTLVDRARARYLGAVTLASAAPVLLMPTAILVAETARGGAIAVPAR